MRFSLCNLTNYNRVFRFVFVRLFLFLLTVYSLFFNEMNLLCLPFVKKRRKKEEEFFVYCGDFGDVNIVVYIVVLLVDDVMVQSCSSVEFSVGLYGVDLCLCLCLSVSVCLSACLFVCFSLSLSLSFGGELVFISEEDVSCTNSSRTKLVPVRVISFSRTDIMPEESLTLYPICADLRQHFTHSCLKMSWKKSPSTSEY